MAITLGTIIVCATSIVILRTFTEGQSFPGGPAAFSATKSFSLPPETVDGFASIIGGWVSDGILVSGGHSTSTWDILSNQV